MAVLINALFRFFDSDGDGVISQEEQLAAGKKIYVIIIVTVYSINYICELFTITSLRITLP